MKSTLFAEKVAIVTGAGQGIGLEIARQLGQAGASIVLNDLSPALSQQACDSLHHEGIACAWVPGDAASPEVIGKLVGTAVEQFGRLDIAIANAGITLYQDFFECEAEDVHRVLNVNLLGTFLLTQASARQMRTQGTGGRILLLSSVVGHQAHPYLAAYAMTKAGIEMLAKNLVVELSPYGITINTIAPGATLTERTQRDDPAYERVWSGITPLGRPATPADIAQAALFLVSDQAAHITGQSLIVDGGWTSVSPIPDLSQNDAIR